MSRTSSFRSGYAVVTDGQDTYEGEVEVAGRTVSIRGHLVEGGAKARPVDKTWINRALAIDWQVSR